MVADKLQMSQGRFGRKELLLAVSETCLRAHRLEGGFWWSEGQGLVGDWLATPVSDKSQWLQTFQAQVLVDD